MLPLPSSNTSSWLTKSALSAEIASRLLLVGLVGVASISGIGEGVSAGIVVAAAVVTVAATVAVAKGVGEGGKAVGVEVAMGAAGVQATNARINKPRNNRIILIHYWLS
jgi:hypothetical protein